MESYRRKQMTCNKAAVTKKEDIVQTEYIPGWEKNHLPRTLAGCMVGCLRTIRDINRRKGMPESLEDSCDGYLRISSNWWSLAPLVDNLCLLLRDRRGLMLIS